MGLLLGVLVGLFVDKGLGLFVCKGFLLGMDYRGKYSCGDSELIMSDATGTLCVGLFSLMGLSYFGLARGGFGLA